MSGIDRIRAARIPQVVLLLLGLSVYSSATGEAAPPSEDSPEAPRDYTDWRKERAAALSSETGYLALAGLYWLREGQQTFGSAPENDLVFPAGRVPAHAGVITVEGQAVTVKSEVGVALRSRGKVLREIELVSDAGGKTPLMVQLNQLTFWLIDRSGRLGIRLRDPHSPILRSYSSTPYFPYDARWLIPARYEPSDSGETVEVPTILGISSSARIAGTLTFSIGGTKYKLFPTEISGADLFVVFGDRTNGADTYGGGRFIKIPIAIGAKETIIDFNKAHNPPCAYSPYTTCPLPIRRNILPLRIDAGERAVKK